MTHTEEYRRLTEAHLKYESFNAEGINANKPLNRRLAIILMILLDCETIQFATTDPCMS